MSLKNAPFVTVVRINQKLKLKSATQVVDAAEKEASLAQTSCFYR